MNYNEFAERIKSKYPEYKDMDNKELSKRMITKYPEYKEQVTFTETQSQEQKKGIDLTPGGLVKQVQRALATPFVAANTGKTLGEAWEATGRALQQAEKEHPIAFNSVPFATDMYVYSQLPMLRAAKGANMAAKVGTFAGNAAIQGGIPGVLEGLKEGNTLGGAGIGTGIAAGLQSIPIAGRAIQRGIENPTFQKGVSKTLEAFTSVPSDYTELALKNELTGNSIFKGKFDADIAYRPIERQLRDAKGMLPTSQSFAEEYNTLGKKALEGMNAIKENAANKIADVLDNLNNKEVTSKGVQNAVNSVINKFGKGGVYNSARRNAPRVINLLDEVLPQEGLTLRDLHRLKNDLYDIGYQAAGAKEGTQAEVARGTAEQINNYLRGAVPGYAAPNDRYSLIMDVERGLDSENTIAKKIKNIGSEGNILSGLDQRLKDVDTLLPNENKFYKQAKEIIQSEKEINDIKNAIGNQYERNPRLLANRTDERFENALNDLQTKTGIEFMPELNKIRAREALEKLAPGQGGGSGSAQGFGNLLRTAIIGGTPTAAAITGNPASLLGLAAISPKIAAKGTIRNLGKVYKAAGREIPESVRKLLTPLAIKGSVPMLYGEISND
jgi:hypothetical protein|nr:MAG TPA: hypothetical protein [Caudoviricetes sp.]